MGHQVWEHLFPFPLATAPQLSAWKPLHFQFMQLVLILLLTLEVGSGPVIMLHWFWDNPFRANEML